MRNGEPVRTDELIRDRVRNLCEIFHRKESAALENVALEHLDRFPAEILRRAFRKMETGLERFPTIRMMLTYCAQEMPSQVWQYNYQRVVVKGPDGGLVNAMKDPKTEQILYRAKDCPEGRAFLAKLRYVAGKLVIPPALPEDETHMKKALKDEGRYEAINEDIPF